MRWTLDQLQQFVATAESGSFSEAARQLGKAQSAVSTAIGLLEADLGVELFDRTRRSARLTNAGEILLLEAQELMNQAQSLDKRAHSLSFGQDAKLSVALDEALPYSVISQIIREIAQYFPDLELTLLNGTATEWRIMCSKGGRKLRFTLCAAHCLRISTNATSARWRKACLCPKTMP